MLYYILEKIFALWICTFVMEKQEKLALNDHKKISIVVKKLVV
jgi:hypothetical protein